MLSCCAGAEPRSSLGQQPGLAARSCSVFWGQGLRGLCLGARLRERYLPGVSLCSHLRGFEGGSERRAWDGYGSLGCAAVGRQC